MAVLTRVIVFSFVPSSIHRFHLCILVFLSQHHLLCNTSTTLEFKVVTIRSYTNYSQVFHLNVIVMNSLAKADRKCVYLFFDLLCKSTPGIQLILFLFAVVCGASEILASSPPVLFPWQTP